MEKKKVTFYISEEIDKNLKKLYAYSLLKGEKTTRSAIISQAIKLAYRKEFGE